MRIVGKKEFIKMPSGTVFSDYKPYVFSGLKIKNDSLPVPDDGYSMDFYYKDIIGNIEFDDCNEYVSKLNSALYDNESISLDFDVCEREAAYDDDMLYAVYEEKDLDLFISVLLNCKQRIKNDHTH